MEAEVLQLDRPHQQQTALLPLDEPRVIAIRDGKHVYTFHFSRITQADWERYFGAIHVTSKNEGRSQVNILDVDTAGMDLFESKLERVEGYGSELKKADFWKIPPRHSGPVGWLLRYATANDEADDAPFNPECVEIKIDALWSQTNPDSGEATLYKRLVHRFAPPTSAQKKRIYRAGAMSKVVGGSRNGTTVYAGRHKVLLDLYDELVQSVEGYSISGRPLASPDEIKREMDGLHKFTAAQQLFMGGSAPASAESEAEAA